MMGGMRGLEAGTMRGPTTDTLSDEGLVGSAYDHKVVSRMLGYLKPYRSDVLVCIGSVLIYTAANVAIPLLVLFTINAYIEEGNRRGLDLMAGVFLAVTLVHFGSNYVQFVFIPKVGQKILYDLRTQMFDHIQSLSPAFHHRTPVGRLISRSTSDVLQIQETFELVVQSLSEILSLGGVIVLMLVVLPIFGVTDVRLGLLCLSVIPVLFFLLAFWQRFARRSFVRIRRAIAMVNGEYNQNITGVRVVESMNRQNQNLAHFEELNREHLDANLQASRFSGALNPMVESLTGFAISSVIVMGGYMVLGGSMEWGVLLAFTLYIQRFFEPIRHLTMQYSQLQRAMAAGTRIFEVLDLRPDVTDAENAVDMPVVKGEVKYEKVSFQYVPDVDVLKEVDLHILPGETAALVGPTGAGKSTLVTLLTRFADVTGGSIMVDGYDLRDVTRQSIVGQMSMVLQEPYLFSGTVKDNIRYNHENVTDEQVESASKAVGAHDFVTALDQGYDTQLAERGANLSVGQRQLLSFARAVVSDPRILILDEATANIDSHTEMLIQNTLKEILKGRTSIIIAHRLSTIRNADKIVVVDQGRVVEVGKHDELLAKGGAYARLYAVNYGLDEAAAEPQDGSVKA